MSNPQRNTLDELSRIYEGEIDYVWRTLVRLGVAERDRADLAHEVFLIVHKKLADYDRSRPLRAWLFGITFRVVLGFKRRASGKEILVDPSEDRDGSIAPTPEDLTSTSERLDFALRALEAIPLERRALFIRHRIDGESIVELAEEMGIPLNTAYSRLRLARADFQRALGAAIEELEE